MKATTLNATVPVTINVRFAPAIIFGVRARMGVSARPTRRARILKLSAALCGNVPADGRPSTGRNASTTKGSPFN